MREDEIELLCSRSTGPLIPNRRQNLVFGFSTKPIPLSIFDGWDPDEETLAIDISWAPRVLAFPSHTYAMARYFRRHLGIEAPEAYFVQPQTGDLISHEGTEVPVFDVPYHQRFVDNGLWEVLLEDGGAPLLVHYDAGAWKAA